MNQAKPIFCSSCGQSLTPGSSFCSGCGDSVSTAGSQSSKGIGNINLNLGDQSDGGFPIWLLWIAMGLGIYFIIQGLLELL